ncbi:MAG TPA: ABC transporter ATP-binding protein [Beijerinckiaceae bacterium]|jgi:ABC-type branched-subunit amino acid transport system ATPase component|nr:ABC transporter ATP-binding protein [Beijerinckiaceae bacterium]
MNGAILALENLTVRFGGLAAVDGVSFHVEPQTVHGLIGPNGAGKTTAFNLISGLGHQNDGHILFNGETIDDWPSWERAQRGLARTFQNIRTFGEMTVMENVLAGMHAHVGGGLGATLLRLPSFRAAESAAIGKARDILGFVGLADASARRAGSLPYGDQRRLEIARALASDPKLMLLDEPAAGMNPSETASLIDLLLRLKARGVTLLLVEHDMHFIMNLCDRITVLNFGRKIAESTPVEVRSDPSVIEAYLGTKVGERLEAGARVR